MMRPDDDEIEDMDDEEEAPGKGIEPTPAGLAHWVAEQYAGDERFEAIEVEEPGPLDEEAVRVKFGCGPDTHFMLSVLADDAIVRLGLATSDTELVERIEAAVEEIGGALTDLLIDGMEAEEEIEHEAEHFHDDMDYFCSDIQYQRDEDLFSDILHEEIVYYLDGYFGAFYDLIFEDK